MTGNKGKESQEIRLHSCLMSDTCDEGWGLVNRAGKFKTNLTASLLDLLVLDALIF